MKTIMNMMAYGLVAGASMYGGYLIGSNNKRRKKVSSSSNHASSK